MFNYQWTHARKGSEWQRTIGFVEDQQRPCTPPYVGFLFRCYSGPTSVLAPQRSLVPSSARSRRAPAYKRAFVDPNGAPDRATRRRTPARHPRPGARLAVGLRHRQQLRGRRRFSVPLVVANGLDDGHGLAVDGDDQGRAALSELVRDLRRGRLDRADRPDLRLEAQSVLLHDGPNLVPILVDARTLAGRSVALSRRRDPTAEGGGRPGLSFTVPQPSSRASGSCSRSASRAGRRAGRRERCRAPGRPRGFAPRPGRLRGRTAGRSRHP